MDPEDLRSIEDDAEEQLRLEHPTSRPELPSPSGQRQKMVAVLSASAEAQQLPRLERLHGPATGISVIVCRVFSWNELPDDEAEVVARWARAPGIKIWYLPNMREAREDFIDPLHPIPNRAAIDGYVLRDGCEVHYPDILSEVYLIVDHHMGDRESLPSACKALRGLAENNTLDVLFVREGVRNVNMMFHDIDEDGAWSIAVMQMWDRLRRGVPISEEAMQTFKMLLEAEDRMDVTGGSAPDVDESCVSELKSVNLPLARQRGERRPKTMEDIYGQIEAFLRNVQRHMAGEHLTLPTADTFVCARPPTQEEPWAVVQDEDPDARRRMRREKIALAVIRVGEKAGRCLYSAFLWDAKRLPARMSEFYELLNRAECLRAKHPDMSVQEILALINAETPASPVPYWGGNGAGGCHTHGSGFAPGEIGVIVDTFCRSVLREQQEAQSAALAR